MKKNKMLRLASALLILVLLTTGIVGSTFAKYVTVGSAADTARVAKWGVVITTGGSLFSDAYAANTNAPVNTAWTATPSATDITVNAEAANQNIVAPGTHSLDNGLKFDISGTPEVATTITGEIKARDIYLDTGKSYGVMIPAVVNGDNWAQLVGNGNLYKKNNSGYTEVTDAANIPTDFSSYYLLHDKTDATDGTTYYPVVYSLTGSTQAAGTSTSTSSTREVAIALLGATAAAGSTIKETPNPATAVTSYTVEDANVKVNPANTSLAGANLFGNEKLSWEWKYRDDTTPKDAEDTILGNMIAAGTAGTTAINDSFVVYSTDTGYADVYYDSANMLAKAGASGDILASLKTSFEISLTVTQVD